MPRPRRPLALAILSGLLLSVAGQAGCFEARYLGRQGVDLFKLMRARRPVIEVIADPDTPPFVRQRLRLALLARQFGIDVLGLHGGGEFTRYVEVHGHLGYNLTVADKTRLRLKTWIFGRLPYLGFLSRRSALDAEEHFIQAGYDTYLREIEAFSGMGFVLSPIYSEMISLPGPRGEVRAVEIVLHEMAHSSVPFLLATELNEPFATVVGNRGAALFFKLRRAAQQEEAAGPGPDRSGQLLAAAAGRDREGRAFSAWLNGQLQGLGALYQRAAKEGWPRAETLRRREAFFAEIQKSYQARFHGGRFSRAPLNNAVLLSYGVYHAPGAERVEDRKATGPGARRRAAAAGHLQEDLLGSVGGDLRAYIELYRQAQERRDGPAWLRRVAQEYRREAGLDPAE